MRYNSRFDYTILSLTGKSSTSNSLLEVVVREKTGNGRLTRGMRGWEDKERREQLRRRRKEVVMWK